MSPKQKFITKPQLAILVHFIRDNPDIFDGATNGTRENRNQLWDDLTELLNSTGPLKKTTQNWRKFYADYKYRVKLKSEKDKSKLNSLDKIILNILLMENVKSSIIVPKTEIMDEVDESMQNDVDDEDIDEMDDESEEDQPDEPTKCSTSLRNKHTTKTQFKILLSFIEEHPELAMNKKGKSRELWEQLTELLNNAASENEPKRTTDKWRKVWNDQKFTTKTRVHWNFNHRFRPNEVIPLNKFQKRIQNVCKFRFDDNADSASVKINASEQMKDEHCDDPLDFMEYDYDGEPDMDDSCPSLTGTAPLAINDLNNTNGVKSKEKQDIVIELLQEQNAILRGIRDLKEKSVQIKEKMLELKLRKVEAFEKSLH